MGDLIGVLCEIIDLVTDIEFHMKIALQTSQYIHGIYLDTH
jgi:hypothetical protein